MIIKIRLLGATLSDMQALLPPVESRNISTGERFRGVLFIFYDTTFDTITSVYPENYTRYVSDAYRELINHDYRRWADTGNSTISVDLAQHREAIANAPEDARFALNFNLYDWSGQRDVSRMWRRQQEGEELGSDTDRERSEVDVSQSVVSAARSRTTHTALSFVEWENARLRGESPTESIVIDDFSTAAVGVSQYYASPPPVPAPQPRRTASETPTPSAEAYRQVLQAASSTRQQREAMRNSITARYGSSS